MGLIAWVFPRFVMVFGLWPVAEAIIDSPRSMPLGKLPVERHLEL
jgi:hypothetical protein